MKSIRSIFCTSTLLFGCLFIGSGCTNQAAPDTESASTLTTIPDAALDRLNEQDRTLINRQRQHLDSTRTQNPSNPELSTLYGEMGRLYLAFEFLPSAEVCFINAQTLEASNYEWPYYLGYIYRTTGDLEKSIEQYRRASEQNPTYRPAAVALGEVYLDNQQIEEAETVFREILDETGRFAPVLVGLGHAAAAQKKYADAVRYFEEALQLAPEATEIHYPLGLAYRNLGNQDKARTNLTNRSTGRASLADPLIERLDDWRTGVQAFNNRGNEAILRGQVAEAEALFRRAVETDSTHATSHMNLGVALSRLDRTEEAYTALQTALGLDSENEQVHLNLGTLLARMGRDDEATNHYRQALALNPDLVGARYNLANALQRLERYPEAEAEYLKVLEQDPGNASARYGHALTLMHRQQWAAARQYLEEGLNIHPDHPALTNALIRILAACPVDSIRDGNRAVTLGRHRFEAEASLSSLEAYAMALAETGRFEEAAQLQQQGIAAARQAGRNDLLPTLTQNLLLYQSRQPARTP